MTYSYDLGNGQRLLVQNDGDNTQVALSSGDSGQKQNQCNGFSTGEWSKPPELFAPAKTSFWRLEGTKMAWSSSGFTAIKSNRCEASRQLENAEKLTLKESNENIARE